MKRTALLLTTLGTVGALLLSCGDPNQPLPPSTSTVPVPPTPALIPVPSTPCGGCAFGPEVFTRRENQKTGDLREFPGDPLADYLLVVQDDNGVTTSAQIMLNGVTLSAGSQLAGLDVSQASVSIHLQAKNKLTVLPLPKTGAKVTVWVLSGAKVLSSSGGTIVAPGRSVTLTVPANALTTSQSISINIDSTTLQIPDPTVIQQLGPIVSLQPSGLAFSVPVDLELRLPPSQTGNPDAALWLYLPDSATLAWVGGTSDSTYTSVRGRISHFSYYRAVVPTTVLSGQKSYRVFSFPTQAFLRAAPPTSLETRAEISRALGEWQTHLAPAGVSFVEAPSAPSPDISIWFASLSWYSDPNAAGVTVIQCALQFVCPPSAAQRGFVLNDTKPWYIVNDDNWVGNNVIEAVAKHEMGHVLTLSHDNGFYCQLPWVNPLLDPACQDPPVMRPVVGHGPMALRQQDLSSLSKKYSSVDQSLIATDILSQSPTQLTVPENTSVPTPSLPRVQIVDNSSPRRGVPGVTVYFRRINGGSVTGAVTTTNGAGYASIQAWSVGVASTSPYQLQAVVVGPGPSPSYEKTVLFQATAVTGSGNGPSGLWTGTTTQTDSSIGFQTSYFLQVDFTNGTARSGACANTGTVQSVTATQITVFYPNCSTDVLTYSPPGTTLSASGTVTAQFGGRQFPIQWQLSSGNQTAALCTGMGLGTSFYDNFNFNSFGASWAPSGGTWTYGSGLLTGDWPLGQAQTDQGNFLLNGQFYPNGDWTAVTTLDASRPANKMVFFNSPGNKYNFEFTKPQAEVAVTYRTNGSTYTVLTNQFNLPWFNSSGTDVVKVLKTGNAFDVSVNGHSVYQFNDNQFNGVGQLGVGAYGTMVYDEFAVCR